MLHKDTILIDVDLTFVNSDKAWLQWMEQVYKQPPDYKAMADDCYRSGLLNYNLSVYFDTEGKKEISPYDFWEDPFLYDKLTPIEGAVEAIEKLHQAGHPIGLVSYCKKGHFGSKVRFLKANLPFLDLDSQNNGCGFYATKYKAGVRGGVIIDDRNAFLNQFSDDVVKIKFDTIYSQEEEPRVVYDLVSISWGDISDFILDTL